MLKQFEDPKDDSTFICIPSFDVSLLEQYANNLPPVGLIKFQRLHLEGLDRIVLPRETLAAWSSSSPFYGYDDSRNVWVERQSNLNEIERKE